MRCNPLRWLVGMVLVIGLLGIMNLRGVLAEIEIELAQQTRHALEQAGLSWADVRFSGRDGWIEGRAPDESEIVKAYNISSSVWGVRKIDSRAQLLEEQRNYTWRAVVRSDKVKLSGYVPNEQTRKAIIGAVKATFPQLEIDDNMRLARGAPDTETWLGAVSFGLKQLSRLKPTAHVTIDNDGLEIEGEALDYNAFRAIKSSLAGNLPTGLRVKRDSVVAPKVEPYVWAARLTGNEVQLGGFLPSEEAREEVFSAAQKSFPQKVIVDRMRVGSGEPENIVAAAVSALGKLAELEEGDVEIKDKSILLSGVAAKEVTVAGLRESLKSSFPKSFRVDEQIKFREPTIKPVSPYKILAEIDGDVLKLTGYAPSEELRTAIRDVAVSRFPQLKVSESLELGAGAPEGWQSCMSAGLTALAKIGKGRVEMEDNILRFAAVTEDETVAQNIENELRAAVNRACELEAKIVVDVPPEPDLKWRASMAEGKLILEGEVPDEASKDALATLAAQAFSGVQVEDRSEVKTGRSGKWLKVAETGLKLLSRLRSGEIQLDGQSLTVSGQAPDTAVAALIRQQLRDLPKGYAGAETIEIRSDAMIWAEEEAKRQAEAEARRQAEEAQRKAEEEARQAEQAAEAPQEAASETAEAKAGSTTETRIANVSPLPSDEGGAAASSETSEEPADEPSAEQRAALGEDGSHAEGGQTPEGQTAAAVQQAALAASRDVDERCQQALAKFAPHGTINFDRAKTDLKHASVITLSRMAEVAASCPNLPIRIEGHADAEGSPEGNQVLSEMRAEAAVKFLVDKGVSLDRIKSVGYGATRPVAPNDTPASRALNRRVEIFIGDH